MNPNTRKYIIIFSVVAVIVVCLISKRYKKESYGTVLGQLANYNSQINNCLNECEKSDPGDRFLAQGNINCGEMCNDIFTNYAEIPIKSENTQFTKSTTDKCWDVCRKNSTSETTHDELKICVSQCVGGESVKEWCDRLWCPYSKLDPKVCSELCQASKSTNNNQNNWVWYNQK